MSRGFGRVRCSCHSPIPPVTPSADFGEAMAVIGGALRRRSTSLPSTFPTVMRCFVAAYPAETRPKHSCDGHNAAFAFFGGVPRSILYDNTKLAVARILERWEAAANARNVHGASVPRICSRTGSGAGRCKGNDKGKVEGLVGFIRRYFLVPVPRCRELRGPQRMLSPNSAAGARRRGCGATRRPSASVSKRDRQVLLPLPPAPYDACDKLPWTGEFAVAGALPQQRLCPCPWPTATVRCSSGRLRR